MDVNDFELNLTPLEPSSGDGSAKLSTVRKWLPLGLIVGLLAGIVVVMIVQVQGSSVYYYNVDEAVAKKAEIGSRDIRLQGIVVGEPRRETNDAPIDFRLAFEGASIKVHHVGNEPPPLFGPGVPSLLEGHFDADGTFVSERIVIKHTEEYREENPGRLSSSIG